MSIMNIVTAVAVILMISVLTVVAIRFGYKALLIEWAIQSGEVVRWNQTGRGTPGSRCVLAA